MQERLAKAGAHSPSAEPPVLTALLLLSLSAADVEDEHDEIAARLNAEKTAFETLSSEKESLAGLLGVLEKLSRQSTQRAVSLQKSVTQLDAQADVLRAESEEFENALKTRQYELGPRLVTLYRLLKHDSPLALLASADFAALLKRQRAMRTLVSADMAELEKLDTLQRYNALQQRRINRLEKTGTAYVKALRGEQTIGKARLTRFQELLATLNAEENKKSREIAELEQSEKELAGLVADMNSTSVVTGFRARKGRLPFPTRGNVEVGYGKIVNPRFNTVTVHKGIDLRAALGTDVVSIGSGTVVFSSWLKGYGNTIIIDHGGNYHSLYTHLANSKVEVGNEVEEGESIGQVGDTGSLKGAYLYFEIRKAGHVVDPQPWLAGDE